MSYDTRLYTPKYIVQTYSTFLPNSLQIMASSGIAISTTSTSLVVSATGFNGGSVTSVSASSNVPTPLFTASVINSTTTPTIVFTVSSIPTGHFYSGPYSALGPGQGSPDVPTFRPLQVGDLPPGISATQIGFGTVNNTEYSYLDGASSNIQDQLNSKGTVSSLTVGNLSPIFTSNVATPTTTPAVTYSLSNVSSGQGLFGPATGAATTPTYRSMVASDMPTTTVNTVGNLSPLFTASISNQALSFVQVQQASGQVLCGPVSGGSANPTFRGLTGLDLQNAVIAGSNVSLALVPSSGQLQISSTGSGGGSTSLGLVYKTTNFSMVDVTNTMYMVSATGGNLIGFLPSSPGDGSKVYKSHVLFESTNTLTIQACGTQFINNGGVLDTTLVVDKYSGVPEITAIPGGWLVT